VKRTLATAGIVLTAVFASAAQSATAGTAGHLSGGGTAVSVATGDPFSQVAFNVSLDGSGGASGSFVCLMAGRSASVLGMFGLSHIMHVHATPTAYEISSDGSVTFWGPAELIMDGGQHVSINVIVWADVAAQQFRLTALIGSQQLVMDKETFASGGISLR
jgi:hypothetical protein